MSGSSQKEFSKALAQALLENDARPIPTPSPEETYRALCYYDPQVQSDEALKKLAQTKPFPPLCNGFVDGLIQCCERSKNTNVNNRKSPTNPEKKQDNSLLEEPSSGHSLYSSTSASGAGPAGYSDVAFVVFLKRPLELLLQQQQQNSSAASNLHQVRQYLGNYECCFVDHEVQQQLNDQEAKEDIERRLRESPLLQVPDAENDNEKNTAPNIEYEEVFAAESDASDYDYDEGVVPQPKTHNQDEIDDYLDSFSMEALTKLPESQLTWSDARKRFIDLIQRFEYSHIAALSNQRWRELGVSKVLSDLAFLLLLQDEQQTKTKRQEESLLYNKMGTTTGNDVHGLRMLWSHFVYILRDRVLDASMVQSDVDALIALIIVLKRLFLRGGDLNQLSPGSGMSPSLSVTLLCLSSICSSADIVRSQRKNAELLTATTSLFPSLAIIAEAIRPSSAMSPRGVANSPPQSSISSSLDHLASLTAIIEFLAGVDLSLNGKFLSSRINPKIASSMVSSGLFRELVLLYGSLSETRVDPPQKLRLLRAIFSICTQSNDCFSFASRVPTFANDVYQSDLFYECNPCDAALWSLLAFTNSSKSATTIKGYKPEQCSNGFEMVCERTIALIESSSSSNGNHATLDSSESGAKVAEHRVNIANKDDIIFFSNIMASSSILASAWRSFLDNSSRYDERARRSLANVRKSLEEWKPRKSNENATSGKNTASRENEDFGLSLVVVNSIRKSIKMLQLIVDEKPQPQSLPNSNSGLGRISSKTD